MSDRITALAQQVTGKKTIDDCSLEELQHMAKRHPYYAPAQFLLLQKLRQAGPAEEAEKQYRKAVLFYHDPLLFEHFISANKFYVEEIAVANDLLIKPAIVEDDVEEEQTVIEEFNERESDISEQTFEARDVKEENFGPIADHQPKEIDVPQTTELPPTDEPVEIKNDEPEAIEPGVKEEVTAGSEEIQEPLTIKEAQIQTGDVQPQNRFTEEKPAAELAFEPFHTVDYFASQGIKITSEEAPKDKLGKQLKSFTEWLKTMKRLPASQMTATAETTAEKKVETLASHSVSESNVVTEAMAEVWLKQGNHEKALDIYNKLSLLNPSKKAYFAAKIENLKQS